MSGELGKALEQFGTLPQNSDPAFLRTRQLRSARAATYLTARAYLESALVCPRVSGSTQLVILDLRSTWIRLRPRKWAVSRIRIVSRGIRRTFFV